MKSLGQQFRDKMKRRRQNQKWQDISEEIAQQLIEGAQNRSRRGETVRGGNYNRRYAESTKKSKGKRDPVTLRDKDYSIKKMEPKPVGNKSAEIRGARRLKRHNDGTAIGGKQRQIFPKAVGQVPRGLKSFARKRIKRILLGVS